VDSEELGGSDHLPIITTVHTNVSHQPITGSAPRWRSNGIDWSKYRDEVEKNLQKPSTHNSLKMRAEAFTQAILDSARKHVRKVKPKKRDNPRMSPKLSALIKSAMIFKSA